MAQVEVVTVTESRPKAVKFKIEMALMLIMAGRTDEARQLFQQAFDMLDQMIKEDTNA